MTRKIVDVEPPQPPFSNHSSPYLATLRIYENSISPREVRRDVFLDAKGDTIR